MLLAEEILVYIASRHPRVVSIRELAQAFPPLGRVYISQCCASSSEASVWCAAAREIFAYRRGPARRGEVCPPPDLAAPPTGGAPMLASPVDFRCTLGVLSLKMGSAWSGRRMFVRRLAVLPVSAKNGGMSVVKDSARACHYFRE